METNEKTDMHLQYEKRLINQFNINIFRFKLLFFEINMHPPVEAD